MNETRSFKETMNDTAMFSLIGFSIVFFVFLILSRVTDVNESIQLLNKSATLVSDNANWILTIYITTLLAFYAVSIGGQIFGDPDEASRIRRNLGRLSMVIGVATVLLAAFSCISYLPHLDKWMLLLTLVPVFFIIMFLAMQLGSFVVSDIKIRESQYIHLRDTAQERLDQLGRKSNRPWGLTYLANTLGISALSWIVMVLTGLPWNNIFMPILVLFIVALILLVSTYCHYFFLRYRGFEHFAVWALLAYAYSPLIIPIILHFEGNEDFPIFPALGMISIILFSSISTFICRSRVDQRVVNWSIHGAGARLASNSLERSKTEASENLKKLEKHDPDAQTLFARIIKKSEIGCESN